MGRRPRVPVSPQPVAALELEALRLSLSNMHAARLELTQAHLQKEKDSALAELRDALSSRHAQELALLHSRQQLQLEEVALRYHRETGMRRPAPTGSVRGAAAWPRCPGPAAATQSPCGALRGGPQAPPSLPLIQLSSGLSLTLKCGGKPPAAGFHVCTFDGTLSVAELDCPGSRPHVHRPLTQCPSSVANTAVFMSNAYEGYLDRPSHSVRWLGTFRQFNGFCTLFSIRVCKLRSLNCSLTEWWLAHVQCTGQWL